MSYSRKLHKGAEADAVFHELAAVSRSRHNMAPVSHFLPDRVVDWRGLFVHAQDRAREMHEMVRQLLSVFGVKILHLVRTVFRNVLDGKHGNLHSVDLYVNVHQTVDKSRDDA